MSLFERDPKEKRSIEDILTPKNLDDEGETTEDTIIDEEKEREESLIDETQVDKSKGIKVETPEEVSFNALTCFGSSETKTPKWLIKCTHFWYSVMSFFWFIFGTLTFAPIIFMQKKVNVIFKDKLKSFIVAALIYCAFLGLIVALIITRNVDKAKEVTDAIVSTTNVS